VKLQEDVSSSVQAAIADRNFIGTSGCSGARRQRADDLGLAADAQYLPFLGQQYRMARLAA
jgi:hypothetical protein